MKTRLVLSSVLALSLAAFAAASDFAAESVGNVVAARKEAWAERQPQQEPLVGKSPVYTGDTLVTNPVGRLQVLFRDDSVLMMAPDSQAVLSEYVYGGGQKPSFHLKLAKGMTRLISGRMVEGNPGAMKVETPDFTVGIQGTRLTVAVNGPAIQVFGEQVTPDLPIIITNKKDGTVTRLTESGKVFEFMPGGAAGGAIRPMTSVDKQTTGKIAMATSAQPMPKIESKLDAKVVALLHDGGAASSNSSLEMVKIANPALIDQVITQVRDARIEGTLGYWYLTEFCEGGQYGFNVNLLTGVISNGSMSATFVPTISGNTLSFNMSGGTGTLNGNNFYMSNLRGTVYSAATLHTNQHNGVLTGTGSNGFRNVGDTVTGGSWATYWDATGGLHADGPITGGRRVK